MSMIWRLRAAFTATFWACRCSKKCRGGTCNPDIPVPPHGATGPGHVCFAMPRDEIAVMRQRLEAAGVQIDTMYDWPNGARSLYVRDPAGNSVEFAEPWLWDGLKG